ncbi:Terpene synthase family, metal binding domain [Micromonospora viridifaciens]|uniref:Terpene synthase n=1 Tax=Micromonospora viridifaciens TaxID=1881 RepID=A0A1C4W4I1_MICVI|nr:terpene synthase [Micromonospora viridifaciens]SCE90959.1 Terpene synthase family, metal binding domain [Micromonospora viridifaciens]
MRSFAVSALREPPFPVRRHAAVEVVAGQSAGWVRELGLIDSPARLRRLAGAAPAELAARACPEAPAEGLRLLTDLICWLFVMDDACDEDGLGASPARLAPSVAELLAVLDRQGDPAAPAPTAGGPLGVALDDLCRRVRARQRPALLLRLVSELREYLLALLWEAANREHRRVPGVNEYVQMRRHTGGTRPSFTLTDLAYDGPPEEGRRADPALAALDALAADLVCWCNDVFSYDKERTGTPDAHNLVAAIVGEDGRDEAAALRRAASLFNDGLAEYAEREAALASGADEAVRVVLTNRRNWIRATYDWSLAASRYA